MIWGKTNVERQRLEREKNAHWFAWFPVELKDGRWAWLEYLEREPFSSWGGSGYYYGELKNE